MVFHVLEKPFKIWAPAQLPTLTRLDLACKQALHLGIPRDGRVDLLLNGTRSKIGDWGGQEKGEPAMVFVRFEFCPLFRLTDLSNYQSEMNQSERTGNDLLGQGGCQKTFLRHVRLFTRKLLCYELQRNISTQNWKETTKRQIG